MIQKLIFVEKYFYYIALAIAFFFPLKTTISEVLLLILLGILLLAKYGRNIKSNLEKKEVKRSTTIVLFVVPTIAILFSETLYDSIRTIGKAFPFLWMPILMLCLNTSQVKKFYKGIEHGFIFGGLIASVLMLLVIATQIWNTPEAPYIKNKIFNYYTTYYSFTTILSKHPTYIGAEILLAFLFVFRQIKMKKHPKLLFLWIGIACVLLVSLVFINSRIILFVLFVLLLYLFLYYLSTLIRNKNYFKLISLFIIILTSIFSVSLFLKDSYVISRFTNELKWELSYQKNTKFNSKTTSDSRIARWSSALQIIKNKPIIGHGNNSEKRLLLEQYQKDDLKHAIYYEYDSHNIYLSYFIEYGVWGTFVLLFFLLNQLYLALKTNDITWIAFVGMIIALGLTENYLRVNEGILLTALFTSCFYFKNLNIK